MKNLSYYIPRGIVEDEDGDRVEMEKGQGIEEC